MALSQDLKITIYVTWNCSMLLFNVIPDWRRPFVFLDPLIELLARIPGIICIAQTTFVMVNNALLVNDGRLLRVRSYGLYTWREYQFQFYGPVPQVAFALSWPISDLWLVTLWQALHLRYMLVWKLPRQKLSWWQNYWCSIAAVGLDTVWDDHIPGGTVAR